MGSNYLDRAAGVIQRKYPDGKGSSLPCGAFCDAAVGSTLVGVSTGLSSLDVSAATDSSGAFASGIGPVRSPCLSHPALCGLIKTASTDLTPD